VNWARIASVARVIRGQSKRLGIRSLWSCLLSGVSGSDLSFRLPPIFFRGTYAFQPVKVGELSDFFVMRGGIKFRYRGDCGYTCWLFAGGACASMNFGLRSNGEGFLSFAHTVVLLKVLRTTGGRVKINEDTHIMSGKWIIEKVMSD
jgi:hypothetical protein